MKLTILHYLLSASHPLSRKLWRARYFVPLFMLLAADMPAAPKTILISLDGATPRLVDQFANSGAIPAGTGLRLLEEKGVKASQNFTISPSLTAAAHIAIAAGATAASTDVLANGFRLLATPNASSSTISGFGAPIGGYSIDGPAETGSTTARPLWLALRASGKVVATATWPGGDGVNVTVPGLTGSPIIQSADKRTVDYTVPFGAGTTPFQRGFPLTASNFAAAPQATIDQLSAAGHPSFSPVRQLNLETFSTGGQTYDIKLAALDSTNDSTTNYDTLVFFDANHGGLVGPFTPAPLGTGPAYIAPATKISALFYFEGHSSKAGVRYFVSNLAPDLSTVRVARSTTSFIPRNTPVLADVDDINNNVGFWQPQSDFRIVERIDATPSTFANFPDPELEAIYVEAVREFVKYQTQVGLRAITRFPNADLVMIYIEQPDGSGHQFFLTDPRQPTDYSNPNSIGAGQDPAKVARYSSYLATAYNVANSAVQEIINAVGVDGSGRPLSNIFVVSDHGFATFHTAVQLQPILQAAGIDTTKLRIVTSGPAANIYINLFNRPDGGTNTVTRDQYIALETQIADALRNYVDANPNYANTAGASNPVFDKIYQRPLPADINDTSFGRRRTDFIGQDSGDVYALLSLGYNFDGRQTPAITRQGDTDNTILSLPNFYGAHGYDPTFTEMSAIFYAAGPNVTPNATPIAAMSNIDVAPTLMRMLGVAPDPTVEGRALVLGPSIMTLQRAVSRKVHGAAGARDVVLSLTGGAAVEMRRAGSGNTHTLVFQFSNNPVSGSAAVTSGVGSVNGSPTFSGNEMIVNLTGVNDMQEVRVTLSNVADTNGGTIASANINAAFLQGDINGNRTVDNTDVAEVNSLGHDNPALTTVNFRGDANVSGAINSTDAAFIRANLGHSLPQATFVRNRK